jgi:hypothetical protein
MDARSLAATVSIKNIAKVSLSRRQNPAARRYAPQVLR